MVQQVMLQAKSNHYGTDILTATISSSDVSLEYSSMDEILKLDNVSAVAPYKTVSSSITRENTSSSKANIIATNDSYLDITNTTLAEGRRLSIIDIENKSKVCILGSEISTTLFSLADPIGEKIKIDGDNYTVIGLLEEQGTSMGTDVDNMILIPLTTAKYLGEDASVNNLYIKVEDESNINFTINRIENYIRTNLQISSDYYSVSSQDSVLDTMEDVTNTLSLLLGGIASISLIVGGIGVMNVMLVSVTERTKEIGIRKSLGAKKIDILFQFLVEALVLSVIGGIIGVATGYGVGILAEKIGYSFSPNKSIVLLSFSSSAIIGLIFGIFPAYKASTLNPIDALRSE